MTTRSRSKPEEDAEVQRVGVSDEVEAKIIPAEVVAGPTEAALVGLSAVGANGPIKCPNCSATRFSPKMWYELRPTPGYPGGVEKVPTLVEYECIFCHQIRELGALLA